MTKPHETAKRHGKKDEAVPETHFKSLALLSYSSLACKPEVCAVTQSTRSCWQPAQSWPGPSMQYSQLCREIGGCSVHLCRAPKSINITCTRRDTALQQTKTVRLQSWLGSWVQQPKTGSAQGMPIHTYRVQGP